MLITPDGQFTIPLDKLDLTETYTDKEKGVVFQTDKERRPIPLEILGSLGTHFKSIQKLRSEAEKQAGIMEKNMQGLLLAAQLTNNPNKIVNAFELLETARAAWTTNKAKIVKEIQRVPANAEELALTREKQQNFASTQRDARDTSMQSNVRENCESAIELTEAYNAEACSFTKRVMEIIKPKLETIIEKKQNNISQDDNKIMLKLLNDIKKEGSFEFDKKYEIGPLGDKKLDMLEIAQEYEKHIYQIKDLPEDYKEYVGNFINAGENAINRNQGEKDNITNYITSYITNVSIKIKDLSAEDQALIIEHAEGYTKRGK